MSALQAELDQHAGQSSPLAAAEANVLSLRRQKLAESFQIQFDAMQELGEKLAIISGHGMSLIAGWDISEQAGKSDYSDRDRTAAVRFSVETALTGWSPHKAYIPRPTIKTGQTSNAPSFHDSHGTELASLSSESDLAGAHDEVHSHHQHRDTLPAPHTPLALTLQSNQPSSLSTTSKYVSSSSSGFGTSDSLAEGIGPSMPFVQQLNNAPVTSLRGVTSPDAGGSSGLTFTSSQGIGKSEAYGVSGSTSMSATPSGHLPTVAETGPPITGTGGPSSGILRQPSSSVRTQKPDEESGRGPFGEQGDGSTVTSLEKNSSSVKGANEREQLPAYATDG